MQEGLGIRVNQGDKTVMIGYWINSVFRGEGMIYYGNKQFLRGRFHGREYCDGFFKRSDDTIFVGLFYREIPMGVVKI